MDPTKFFKVFLSTALFSLYMASFIYADVATPKNIWGGTVTKVVEDPSHPGTFYAAGTDLFKSADGGATWVKKPFGVPLGTPDAFGGVGFLPRVHGVTVSSDGVVLAANQDAAPVWRSDDGGETWQRVASFDTMDYANFKLCTLVRASIKTPNNFFAVIESMGYGDGTGNQPHAADLWMSADKGVTFTKTNLSATNTQSIVDVLEIPEGAHAGRIVAAILGNWGDSFGWATMPDTTTCRIVYSDDAGANWTGLTTPANIVPSKMTWDASNKLVWLISKRGGIYKSADQGATWTAVYKISNVNESAALDNVIFYSSCSTPTLFAISPKASAMSSAMIYKSTDAAGSFTSWYQVDLPSENYSSKTIMGRLAKDIVVDHRDPTGKSWGIADLDRSFFCTTDDGATVTQGAGINNATITYGIKKYNNANPGASHVFALEGTAVHHSADNGDTWARIFPAPGRNSIQYCVFLTFDPAQNSSKLYMTGDRKIFVSNNYGADYFNQDTPLADFGAGTYNYDNDHILSNLLIDYNSPNIMYIGVTKNGTNGTSGYYMYKSSNSGVNWTVLNSLDSYGIYYLAMDPVDPNLIYAACTDGALSNYTSYHAKGLFKSADGGSTWTDIALSGGVNIFNDKRITLISIDSATPNAIVVNYYDKTTGNNEVQISQDKGATWSHVMQKSADTSKTTPENAHIMTFLVNGGLIAGSSNGQIWQSPDLDTQLTLLTTLPSPVTWIFKGSVYATSNTGLYSLSIGSADKTYSGSSIKVYNHPNPFNPKVEKTVLRYALAGNATNIRLRVYTLSGELVWENTVTDSSKKTGGASHGVTWDGKNQSGNICAPGLYFVVVDVDGLKARNKIVITY